MELRDISMFDLYFFVAGAWEAIEPRASLLDPWLREPLGEAWRARMARDLPAFRGAVERLMREQTEASDALRTVHRLLLNVSEWREMMVSVARSAPAPRRQALLRAAGYGAGSARTAKEMKDLLLTVKTRIEVHGPEFEKLGVLPPMLQLPARVLAALEGGAADVAREKAEETLARADLAEVHVRVVEALEAVWRAAGIAQRQALLLTQYDDATPEQKQAAQEQADDATELLVTLEKVLGEARVEAQRRAATRAVPVEVLATDATQAAPPAPAEDAKVG